MLSATLTLAASDPVAHAVDHWFLKTDSGLVYWTAYSSQLVLAGIITLLVGRWAATQIATGDAAAGNERYLTRNPFAHTLEVICVYLRDEMVRPLLGDRTDKMMPFLWSLFFFVLVNNLLGLLPMLDVVSLFAGHRVHAEHWAPIGGTATQSLWVTGALAIFAFVFINLHGIKELGVKEYVLHLTGGVPLKPAFLPIVVIVFIIEGLGILIKPAALAIRLMANMTAGHILLATLFGFASAGVVAFFPASIAAFAVYLLELFVAFIQAFIFFFLTAVFTSLLAHHDDGHEHHEAVDELPDAMPAPVPA